MTATRARIRIVACGALAALFCGCGDDLPRTVAVAGRVTYNGAPVTPGSVRFTPLEMYDGHEARPATGTLQADGSFAMSCFPEKPGVLPGKYAVTVFALHSYGFPDTPAEKPDYAIPERYVHPATSQLTCDVSSDSGDKIQFDIELAD